MQTNSSEKKNLLLIKVSLVLILLGILIVGKRIRLWPIVTWSVYSRYSPKYPKAWTVKSTSSSEKYKSSISVDQLRVITQTGEIYELLPGDLLSVDRDNIDQNLMQQAFDNNYKYQKQARFALVSMIQKRFPKIQIQSIEKWQLDWNNIDLLKMPPLDKKQPSQEKFIGKFEIESF